VRVQSNMKKSLEIRLLRNSSLAPRSEHLVYLRQFVRVVSRRGKQLGLVTMSDALKVAEALDAGLVRVAATTTPPVYRVVDSQEYRQVLMNHRTRRRREG